MDKRQAVKIIETLARKMLKESTLPVSQETYEAILSDTNHDFDKIADLFLELLDELNHHTLRKYMARFFHDYETHGYKVEDTSLYDIY